MQTPSFTIAKVATEADVDTAGDVIHYTITLTNTGNMTLTGVTVSDPRLADLDCDGTAGLPYVTSGLSIAVGGNLVCTGTYTVLQSDIDNNGGGDGDIDNTVTGDTDQTLPDTAVEDVPVVQTPSFTIAKVATEADVDTAGDVIHYTITLTNTGNMTLTGVTVSDPRLADLDCDGTAGLPYVTSGLSIAVGGNLVCTGTYTVLQSDIDNNGGGDGDIDNTVTGDTTETTSQTAVEDVPIILGSSFTIAKVATEADVDTAGDVIHYTITLTNTGNMTLTGVTVSDPRLADLDCDGTAGLPYVTSGLSIAVGGNLVCTGTYTVLQSDIDNNGGGDGDIDNTVTGDTDQTLPDTAVEDVPVVQTPSFTIAKVATEADVDAAGDVIHYTITLTNTGNMTLTGVTVSDPRLADLDCDGTAGLPYVTSGLSIAVGGNLVCTGTYTVLQSDIDNNGGGDGDIDNTVTGDTTETTSQTAVEDVPIILGSSFTIAKVATEADVDTAGDVIHYTITLTNTGNMTLTGVTVSDPRLADLDCDGTAGLPYVTSGLSIAVGGNLVCTGTYTVLQSDIDNNGGGDGDIDNTVTGDTDQTLPDTAVEAVPVVQTPSFTIAKVATEADVDTAGDVIHYTITLTNTGNMTLTGVTVSDPRLADLDCDGTAGLPYVTSGLSIAVGGNLVCTGTYTVLQSDIDNNGGGDGDIDNTVTGDTDQTLPDTAVEAVPVVQTPSFTIAKVATEADVDTAGDVIHYTITLTNTGNMTLTGVTVSDPRLADLDCDGTAGLPYVTSGLSIAVGGNLVCTGTYTVLQSDIDNNGGGDGDIDNTVTGDTDQTLPDTAVEAVPVVQTPSFTIAKVATEADVDTAGDVIHYTITLTNTGNMTLTGVTVSDPRLADLDCDGTAGLPYVTSGLSIAVGGNLVCTGTYTVLQSDIDNNGGGDGDIDNTVTGDTDQTVEDTADEAVPVVQTPSFTIAKVATEADVDTAGDVIHYTITLTNTGNMTLTGVTVSDPRLADLDCDGTAGLPYVTSGLSIAVGGNLVCTGTYTVLQSDIDNNGGGDGDIDNTVTGDTDQTLRDTAVEDVPRGGRPELHDREGGDGSGCGYRRRRDPLHDHIDEHRGT